MTAGAFFFYSFIQMTLFGGATPQGYGRAALKTLLSYGFDVLGLNKIWGETFEHNTAANRLFLSIGMNHAGTRAQHYYREGEWIDALMYEIIADDYTG